MNYLVWLGPTVAQRGQLYIFLMPMGIRADTDDVQSRKSIYGGLCIIYMFYARGVLAEHLWGIEILLFRVQAEVQKTQSKLSNL